MRGDYALKRGPAQIHAYRLSRDPTRKQTAATASGLDEEVAEEPPQQERCGSLPRSPATRKRISRSAVVAEVHPTGRLRTSKKTSINVSIPDTATNPRIWVAGIRKPVSSRIAAEPPRPDARKCAGSSSRFSKPHRNRCCSNQHSGVAG